MMKTKKWTPKFIVLAVVCLLIGIGAGLFILSKLTTIPTSGGRLIPNPASVYCEEQTGTLEIRTDADGNQRGFCLFADGSECEEWKFFQGECKKGEKFCKDLCGDGICQEVVCMAIGCPCPETPGTCSEDCK